MIARRGQIPSDSIVMSIPTRRNQIPRRYQDDIWLKPETFQDRTDAILSSIDISMEWLGDILKSDSMVT